MKKILIADANKISVLSTTEIFKEQYPGIKVLLVGTAKDAIQMAQTHPDFDALIIDFELPDENGVKTCARLEKLSKTPVFLTGFETQEVESAIKSVTAKNNLIQQNFLKKPLQADVVHAVCAQHMSASAVTKTIKANLVAFVQNAESKNQGLIPVVIQECGLECLKIKTVFEGKSLKIKPHNKKSNEKNNIIIYCQPINSIEFGENLVLEQIIDMPRKSIISEFSFIIHGCLNGIDAQSDTFWIQSQNKAAMKKLFEALSFQAMHKNMRYQMTLLPT